MSILFFPLAYLPHLKIPVQAERRAEGVSSAVRALAARGVRLLLLLWRFPCGSPVYTAQLPKTCGEGAHRLPWKSSQQVKEK